MSKIQSWHHIKLMPKDGPNPPFPPEVQANQGTNRSQYQIRNSQLNCF
jgi:hypothetical protein